MFYDRPDKIDEYYSTYANKMVEATQSKRRQDNFIAYLNVLMKQSKFSGSETLRQKTVDSIYLDKTPSKVLDSVRKALKDEKKQAYFDDILDDVDELRNSKKARSETSKSGGFFNRKPKR
jgi:hypothetical protein